MKVLLLNLLVFVQLAAINVEAQVELTLKYDRMDSIGAHYPYTFIGIHYESNVAQYGRTKFKINLSNGASPMFTLDHLCAELGFRLYARAFTRFTTIDKNEPEPYIFIPLGIGEGPRRIILEKNNTSIPVLDKLGCER